MRLGAIGRPKTLWCPNRRLSFNSIRNSCSLILSPFWVPVQSKSQANCSCRPQKNRVWNLLERFSYNSASKSIPEVRATFDYSFNRLMHSGTETKKEDIKNKFVIIEGNIGVGKTVLSKDLGKLLNYKVYHEPATQNPYLAKFYEEPHRYAIKLQVWLFEQRFLQYIDAMRHIFETGQGVILDRSVYSDVVFANVSHADGFIDERGYSLYQKLRQQAMSHVLPPHVVLFLDVSAETCQQRIIGRGRSYEQSIPLLYLTKLEKEYRNLLEHMRETTKCNVFWQNWETFGAGGKDGKYSSTSGESQERVTEEGARRIAAELQKINHSGVWKEAEIFKAKEFLEHQHRTRAALTIDNMSVGELLNVP